MTENASQLRRKIADLEGQLAQIRIEKDDLARDVEALCMETTANTTFSSSSVLRERIFSTEKELSKTKSELVTVTGERNSLKEDLREIKDAKKIVEQSYRDQTTRIEALERELAFYRKQATQAITDRDNAHYKCEQLKQTNAELTTQIRDAKAQADTAIAERTLAERRLQDAETRIKDLTSRAEEGDKVPGLRADIMRYKAKIDDLQKQNELLQEEILVGKREMSKIETALQKAERGQEDKAAEAEAVGVRAQEELVEVTRQKVDALLRLSESEAARTTADREVERLSEQLESVQDQLQQATQEKVRALMLVAEFRSQQVVDGSSGGGRPGSAAMNGNDEKKDRRSSWLSGFGIPSIGTTTSTSTSTSTGEQQQSTSPVKTPRTTTTT